MKIPILQMKSMGMLLILIVRICVRVRDIWVGFVILTVNESNESNGKLG